MTWAGVRRCATQRLRSRRRHDLGPIVGAPNGLTYRKSTALRAVGRVQTVVPPNRFGRRLTGAFGSNIRTTAVGPIAPVHELSRLARCCRRSFPIFVTEAALDRRPLESPDPFDDRRFELTKLRVHAFAVSVDGYGAGPNQNLDNPLGVGGLALHEWMFARTGQKMFGMEGGETGVDDDFTARGSTTTAPR